MSARKASDFSQFKEYLQQWVDISLQKAAAIDPSKPAYDVSCSTAGRQLAAIAWKALVFRLLAWFTLCHSTFCMFMPLHAEGLTCPAVCILSCSEAG